MKTITSIFAVLTLSLGQLALAETSVRDLNPPARVNGVLGKPLGTRTIITGILAERVMLVNPLAVSQIDGQVIKDKVSIEIRGKPQIKQGVYYRLEGYESGEFSGPPSWLSPEAQQPFQYHSFFIVTKVIEPERNPLAADQINAERAGRNFEYFRKYLAECPETQVRCLWLLRENVGIGMVMTIDLREATVHTVRDVFDHAHQNSKTRDMSHAQTVTARELLAKLPGGVADLSFPEGLHISFWHENKLHTYTYSKKATPLIVQRLYDVGGGENDFTYEK